MLYISVDVEASGLIPGIHNLVSIGATPVREKDGRFEIGSDFYVELKPDFEGFQPQAMAIHGISKEHLEMAGLPSIKAMERFRDFVLDEWDTKPPRPIFVGHNAAFDWAYIKYYFHHTNVKNPFNIFPLDIKALTMGSKAIPWARARKRYFRDSMGVSETDESLRHRADYDARYQARMFVAVMDSVFQGRSSAPDAQEISAED
jgi:DNA polymerase III epsilon subunit-like protein